MLRVMAVLIGLAEMLAGNARAQAESFPASDALMIKTKSLPDIAPALCDAPVAMFDEGKAASVYVACFLRTVAGVNLDGAEPGKTVATGYNNWLAPHLHDTWVNTPGLAIGIREGFTPSRLENVSWATGPDRRTVIFGCLVSVKDGEARSAFYMLRLGANWKRDPSRRKDGFDIQIVTAGRVRPDCEPQQAP